MILGTVQGYTALLPRRPDNMHAPPPRLCLSRTWKQVLCTWCDAVKVPPQHQIIRESKVRLCRIDPKMVIV